MSTPTVDDGNGVLYHPVAYVRKTGAGGLFLGRSMCNMGNNEGGKVYWLVEEGELGALQASTSQNALGATAGTWVSGHEFGNAKDPAIAMKHLEGIKVSGGATLSAGGVHGFLPASKWKTGAYAHEEGDGWNPGEFILEDGASLYGRLRAGNTMVNTPLVLGLSDAGVVYHAYPTIKAPGGGTATVTFGGDITFRSGIDGNSDNFNAVIDGGTVRFTNDLPGAIGFGKMQNLDIRLGTASMYNNSQVSADTAIAKSAALEFNSDGNALPYPGQIVATGTVRGRTGLTDLGTNMIASSGAVGDYNLLVGGFSGEYWSDVYEETVKNIDWAAMGTPDYTRADAVVDFMDDASFNLPTDPNVWPGGLDNFSVRWTATLDVDADEAGIFEFSTESDDGTVLWIDDEIVVDNDGVHAPATVSGTVYLAAGTHQLVLGMHEIAGGARSRLMWNNVGVGTGIFDGTGPNIRGFLNVDAGATLKAGGFTDMGITTLDGNLTLNGTATSTGDLLRINASGALNVGSASLDVATGVINGTLAGDGTGTVQFGDLTLNSPTIDLTTAGLLKATTATVASPYTFGPTGKAEFGSLAVNANTRIGSGGSVKCSNARRVGQRAAVRLRRRCEEQHADPQQRRGLRARRRGRGHQRHDHHLRRAGEDHPVRQRRRSPRGRGVLVRDRRRLHRHRRRPRHLGQLRRLLLRLHPHVGRSARRDGGRDRVDGRAGVAEGRHHGPRAAYRR